jgi:putative phosphoesterase
MSFLVICHPSLVNPMKIGVISDTHNFLDPKIATLFAGVEHILHAGDIGNASIISGLEAIAPVTAVYGNTDMNLPFRETETIMLAGRKFLIHHIVNPVAPGERVVERIARELPDVVIFGHTHKRFCETLGGILFFNPGYSGKPKLNLERSVAILHCGEEEIRPEYIQL